MLPLSLAAGPLSLRAGQRTAAVSVAVRLDSAGAIADRRIARVGFGLAMASPMRMATSSSN
jgi:exoribonuclease R